MLTAAVDDLSEINNLLQCLECSDRFKQYDNFCYFDKLRNNVLGYECENCDAFRGKSFETVSKNLKTHIPFVKIIIRTILKKILMKKFYYYQKTRMFIRTNTWTLLLN